MIRGIRRWLLIRSNLFRPLLLRMLVVARLLATGRSGRALALLRIALTLSLFNCLPILFQNRAFDRTGAFDLFRNWGLANNFANWLGSERSAASLGNNVHLWSFVNDDATA
jgi:hypothetical protein